MKTRISAAIEQVGLPMTEIVERAATAAKLGVDGLWVSQLPSQRDTGTLLAGLAASTQDVTIGTAVLPIYTRPPVVMAQMALTLDELSGNRLVLGLGRGSRMFGEWMLGGTYASSVEAVREYLTIVTSLIQQGQVSFAGRWFQGNAMYAAPRPENLPIYLGSFSPRTLELAAELVDGVILWMCTPTYTRDVVMPSLRRGWSRRAESRGGFAVVAMLPAVVSREPAKHREDIRRMLAGYVRMENYQKLLVASGFGDDVRAGRPGDAMIDELAACGSAQDVRERIYAFREAGVTDVAVSPLTDADSGIARFIATMEAAMSA